MVVACPGGFSGQITRPGAWHRPQREPRPAAGGRPGITSRHRRGWRRSTRASRPWRRSASIPSPGYITSSITRMLPCGQLSACGTAPIRRDRRAASHRGTPPTGRDCRAIRHRETLQNAAGRALSPPQPRSRSIEAQGAGSPARHRISLVAATKVNSLCVPGRGSRVGAGRVTSVTTGRVTSVTIRKAANPGGQGFFPVAAAFSGRRRQWYHKRAYRWNELFG